MNKVVKVLLFISTIVVIFSFLVIIFSKLMEQPEFSKDDARIRVEKVYSGEIKSVLAKNNGYSITFEKENGIYEVFINKVNGKFSNLTLIKETEEKNDQNVAKNDESTVQKPVSDSKSTAKKNEKNPTQKPILLTENQVKVIALKEFPGVVEDIDYVNGPDGGYYLVEVEKGEEETEFQIHAVTGKILSIKFDD